NRPRHRRTLHRTRTRRGAEPRPSRRSANRAEPFRCRSAQRSDTNSVGQRQAGGEEFATAFALLGVRPVWDRQSYRVTGIETEAIAELGRPRVDVTLRISGLFRDMFGAQMTLFDSAVNLVAHLQEDAGDNPLREIAQPEARIDRIFGPAESAFGAGVMGLIDSGDWTAQKDLGRSYLKSSDQAYRGEAPSTAAGDAFERRVQAADAFVHIQDHREIDLLTGGDFAAHEGGFAAAAA